MLDVREGPPDGGEPLRGHSIGGFDLGLERAGMRSVWQCEIDPYAIRVLEKHWPDVLRVRDVRDVGAGTVPYVDVICGGFPCQDLSYAGKGAGLDGERSGLWSEYARVVGELRPRYVVVENVSALLARGLGRVLGDLAALGYDAEWDCIPASAVGAPHRRDRVWLVAYPNGEGEHDGAVDAEVGGASQPLGDAALSGRGTRRQGRSLDAGQGQPVAVRALQDADLADAHGARLEGHGRSQRRAGEQPSAAGRADVGGWSEWWSSEPDVGRVAHGVPARVDRLRALGNALVPQIAELIGRRIIEWERVS